MATLKQRMHKKNSSGTYDTVHLETSSSLVLRPSGRTVEQDLADYLPKTQASDTPPSTLKSGSMVAGANKVFCGTENGVCELTKDTVYVHPSDKQCSWTPSVGFVDLFKEVCSKTTTYRCTLTASDFGEGSGGGGLYMIYWNVSVSGNVYCWGYNGERTGYQKVGGATSSSQSYIYQFIYVPRVDSVIRASIIPGTWVISEDLKGYSHDYSPSITFTFLSNYNGMLTTENITGGSGTLKLYKLKHYNWS